MGETEKAELKKKCICTRCPSYDDCAKKSGELLFCLEGKSACKLARHGCICGACPVEKTKGFAGAYFCTDGKADSE